MKNSTLTWNDYIHIICASVRFRFHVCMYSVYYILEDCKIALKTFKPYRPKDSITFLKFCKHSLPERLRGKHDAKVKLTSASQLLLFLTYQSNFLSSSGLLDRKQMIQCRISMYSVDGIWTCMLHQREILTSHPFM